MSSKTYLWTSLFLATVGLFGQGCSATSSGGPGGALGCSAELEGQAFVQAEGQFEAVVNNIQFSVATACRNIAVAGGKTPMWDGTGDASTPPTDDQLKDSCNLAATVVGEAQAAASGMFSLTVTGGECHADVSAQADCTANCSGSADCKASGSVMCSGGTPPEVTCGAMCTGSCDWDGTTPIDCQGECDGSCSAQVMGGTCSGTCQGTCSGTCSAKDAMGNCAGTCQGMCTGTCQQPMGMATCMGKCSGSCKLQNPAMCSGKCAGSCSVMGTAPTCKGEAPMINCNASASCQSSCQASAQATATCTPPMVTIVAGGMVDAKVITALQTNLPQLFLVAQVQGKALVDVAGNASAAAKNTLQGGAACVAEFGGKIEAMATASLHVQASFSASASVSGKASGGAG